MSMNSDDITPVIVEDATEKVTVTGSCDLCGKCCRPPVFRNSRFIVRATKFNGDVPLDGECKYLTEVQLDGCQLCKLFIAEADGKLGEYDEDDVEYWKRCCKPWPTYGGEFTLEWIKLRIDEGCFDDCSYAATLVKK